MNEESRFRLVFVVLVLAMSLLRFFYAQRAARQGQSFGLNAQAVRHWQHHDEHAEAQENHETSLITEESMMLERFGDGYREYMSRTGRLVPKF